MKGWRMTDIYLQQEFYAYDAFHIIKAFLPNEEVKQHIDGGYEHLLSVSIDGKTVFVLEQEEAELLEDKKEKRAL